MRDHDNVLVVVGLQYGDEGKGKIVDALAQGMDVVIRYNGGANAGHTVEFGSPPRVFKLHLVPSGIFNPDVWCLLGNGAVVDPTALTDELALLQDAGVALDRFRLSENAHLVMPWHKVMDQAQERLKGSEAIGTTGRGIGPCYVDKVARSGLRVGDLRDLAALKATIEKVRERKARELDALVPQGSFNLPSAQAIFEEVSAAAQKLVPFIARTDELARDFAANGNEVLLEAAQGTMIDLEVGTYPYVTSSYATSAGACIGSGLPPTSISGVIGVAKAYTTRVGNGSMAAELLDDRGEALRRAGNEFGTTTGRPRRCGWFEAALVRRAVEVNGCDEVVVTKLDVLSVMDRIGIAHDSGVEVFEGWKTSIAGARDWAQLPAAAQAYVRALERCLGVPVTAVSTGAHRDDLVMVPPAKKTASQQK